jgi:hypothetical protein
VQDRVLAVHRRIEAGGIHVFGCALKPRLIDLDAKKFIEYLESERAESAIRQVRTDLKSAEPNQPITERYTKFAKTIVEVGPVEEVDGGFAQPVGHRLEIIPLSNPCRWKAGGEVEVRVVFDGHPWKDVAVSAGFEGGEAHDYAVKTRTNKEGVAKIALSRPGHGFIKVHLIRPIAQIGHVQWESFWATLTFRAIGRSDVASEFRAIRAMHGRLSPAALAGYRMGRSALETMSHQPGSPSLSAVVLAPADARFAGLADGIQASAGLSLGRMTLRLEPVETADACAVMFTDHDRGASILFRLRPGMMELIEDVTDESAERCSLLAATFVDEALFDSVPLSPMTAPGAANRAASQLARASASASTPPRRPPSPGAHQGGPLE